MTGPVRVGGLDLSTKRIGYAAPNGATFSISARTGAEDPTRRCYELRRELGLVIARNPPTPTLYVIEDYQTAGGPTLGSTISRVRLGEIGMAVRLMLFEWDARFVEVEPNTIKRFATGAAGGKKADKDHMIAAAEALGAVPANDDEADAWHARRMGLCAYGLEPMVHDHEREAVASVKGW